MATSSRDAAPLRALGVGTTSARLPGYPSPTVVKAWVLVGAFSWTAAFVTCIGAAGLVPSLIVFVWLIPCVAVAFMLHRALGDHPTRTDAGRCA
jgi:hypothetical protein